MKFPRFRMFFVYVFVPFLINAMIKKLKITSITWNFKKKLRYFDSQRLSREFNQKRDKISFLK